MNDEGAVPARTAPQETAAARLTVSTSDDNARTDSSKPLSQLVGYVISGRDNTPLNRLYTAAKLGRGLVEVGVDRVSVAASLTLAGEAAGVPRRVAEAVVGKVMRGAP